MKLAGCRLDSHFIAPQRSKRIWRWKWLENRGQNCQLFMCPKNHWTLPKRGVWMCIAGVFRHLQTTSFEIPWFLGWFRVTKTTLKVAKGVDFPLKSVPPSNLQIIPHKIMRRMFQNISMGIWGATSANQQHPETRRKQNLNGIIKGQWCARKLTVRPVKINKPAEMEPLKETKIVSWEVKGGAIHTPSRIFEVWFLWEWGVVSRRGTPQCHILFFQQL